MTDQNIDELTALIKARVEAAKENDEELTKEDIIEEFGLNDENIEELSAGHYGICQLVAFFC